MQSFLDQKPVKFEEEAQFHLLAQRGLGQALEEGLHVAAQYAKTFISMEQGSSLGLAELLHGVNLRWNDFEDREDGDTFWGWASRETGRATATVQRDICIWEWMTGDWIPGEYAPKIQEFSVKMLKKAYNVSLRHKKNKYTGQYEFESSGYEIEPADWLALSECVDDAMLIPVMDKITGKEPNSNRVAFKMDGNGSIWFFRGKKDSTTIGSLSVNSQSQLVRDGIAELLERAGITEFEDG